MALSYNESNQLMQDGTFRGRVKVACLKFAQTIEIEVSTIPAHNARLRWAQQCIMNPDQTAQTVTNPTVMDPAVQTAGSTIDDAGLQAAVEGVVNGLI